VCCRPQPPSGPQQPFLPESENCLPKIGLAGWGSSEPSAVEHNRSLAAPPVTSHLACIPTGREQLSDGCGVTGAFFATPGPTLEVAVQGPQGPELIKAYGGSSGTTSGMDGCVWVSVTLWQTLAHGSPRLAGGLGAVPQQAVVAKETNGILPSVQIRLAAPPPQHFSCGYYWLLGVRVHCDVVCSGNARHCTRLQYI
jgi:hypothetical protein